MRYTTGVICVIAAGTLWSLMGLALRQIDDASVWAILLWRSVGMVPVLAAYIAWSSHGHPINAIRRVGIAGTIGGAGLVVAFAGAIYAIQSTTIANAVFLFTASPFVAAILGWILLREQVRPATWAAIALAIAGMFIMVREGLAIGAMNGNIAALLSAAGFGAFSVALRWGKLADMTPAILLGGVFSIAAAAIILTLQGQPIIVSTHDMILSMAIGAIILATGLSLYTLGSRVIPAADLTLISMVEVMLAPVWVWLFLAETASLNTFIGGAILLCAVAFNALSGARARGLRPVDFP
jgi:drug/metabolite transporter, DME family